jgi:hypothetical protein
MELPEFTRLEVIEIGPNDILVLRFPAAISQKIGNDLRQDLEARFPGHRCLVIGDGGALEVLRETAG